ncbi:MAG TPA: hypothetical protein DDW30_07895 [Clostridiales bacterium]|nr:hypothetical protein [Clostridiales bacterium]
MKNARKMLERLGLGTLALAMALGLAACGKKDPTPSDETDPDTKEETTAGGDGELKPNYSGNTYNYDRFRILMRNQSDYVNEMAVEDENGTDLDKKVYYRNRAVEDQLKIILLFDKQSEDGVHSAVQKADKSGTNTYGLVLNHGMKIFREISTDYYADWSTMPTINLEASWWSQNLRNSWTTPSGALYAANGDISYLSVGAANCMFFNKNLVTDAQGTDPYQLVADNNWTFATFFESAEEVGATLKDNGGFGYQSQNDRGPMDALYATGYPIVVVEKEGGTASYKLGIDNERTITAMDQFTKFVNGEYAKQEKNREVARANFTTNTIAYFDDNVSLAASTFRDMEFGILPFPKYDDQVANYQSLVGSGTDTFAIPRNTTEEFRGCIGDVVECLAYNGYVSVMPYYYETLLKGQAAKDPQSLKSLQIIHDTLIFDLGHYLSPGGIAFIATDVAGGKYSSFANALEHFKQDGGVSDDMKDFWLSK